MADQVGSAYIPVRPDMRGFHQAIQREVGQAGDAIGRALADAIRRGLGRGNPFEPFEEEQDRQRRRAPRQGSETAGAYAESFQRRLRQAARSLPHMEVEADTDPAERAMQELRARMLALSEKKIGVDIEAGQALAEMAAIEAELQRLRAESPNIQIQTDTARAIAQLEAVRAEAERIARERATVQIDADIAAARARMAALQAEIDRLRTQEPTVQVQADIAAAMLQMQAIQAEIARLETDRANIQVDADTAGANAQLAIVGHQARELDGKHVGINVGVDIAGALAALATLRGAIAGIGLLAGPQLAAVGAGVIGLAGPLAAAGAGFGGLAAVALPSISHISDALKQQKTATTQAASSSGQAARQALSEAGAQQQLAAAVRQAGYAHQQAVQQVKQAEQQLTQAQQSAKQAQEALTQARKDAARALVDQQNSLIDAGLQLRGDELAVERARLALQKLTTARQDDAAVAKAEAGLANARQQFAGISADPNATAAQKAAAEAAVKAAEAAVKAKQDERRENELARKEAALAYQEAVQQLKEQQLAVRRLTADEAAARKAGVEGSDAVRQARQQLADANARVQQSEQALAAARANVARVDQQSQEQIASARRAAAAAALSGASANNALGQSMTALTGPERALMVAWQGLQQAFTSWAEALQPAVLPLLVQGINLVKGALPLLTPIVLAAASAVHGLLDQLGVFLKSPLFTQFAASLAKMAGPAITAFGQIGLNVIKSVIGIINAFAPIGQAFLGVLVQMTGAFAKFTTGLVSNPAFQQFVKQAVQILTEMGTQWSAAFAQLMPIFLDLYKALSPVISSLRQALFPVIAALVPVVGLLVHAIGQILVALAPVLVVVGRFAAQLIQQLLPVLTPIINTIAQVAVQIGGILVQALRDSAPALQQLVLAVASLLPQLLPLLPLFAQWVATIAPLLPLVLQLAAVLLTALMPVLQLGITILVKYWSTIAALVLPIFRTMVSVLTWVAGILTPILQGIGAALRWVGTAATWLWTNAILPAFHGIATIAQWLYTAVAVMVLAPLVIAFKVVAAIATWLWKSVIVPVFNGIAKVVAGVWNGYIKPVLTTIGNWLKSVFAPVWRWLYSNVIAPVWGWISSKISSVWHSYIQPTFNAIKSAVGRVGDAFSEAVGWIGRKWDELREKARKPVAWVIDVVFNKGVLRMWNSVADLVPGSKHLNPIKFASGGVLDAGVLPGYSPGKDIHRFWSPTGGALDLSGGESIMRPEWTSAVGERWVQGMNYLARTKGSRAVVQALGVAGDPSGLPRSAQQAAAATAPARAHHQAFFLGGIVDKFLGGAKSMFAGGLVNTAKKVVGPLLNAARSAVGGSPFGDWILGVPKALLGMVINHFKGVEGSGKLGGAGGKAVALARTQVAKHVPYVWGGTSWNHGLDCSALLQGAWERAAPGHSVPRTTYTQKPWLHPISHPVPGAFGQPHPGHTYMASDRPGYIIEEPYTGATAREVPMRPTPFWGMPPWLYDDGGWLDPGIHLVANYTRKPEAILPPGGLERIASAAAVRGGDGATSSTTYNVYPRTLDMTVADLERLQTRHEAGARIGRPY